MPTVADIIHLVEELAPPQYGLPGDPGGLQLGEAKAEVRRVLVALDLTGDVLDRASAAMADLIVLHHPPVFRPLTDLRADRPHNRLLLRAAAADVAICAWHTALDSAPGGINDWLAARLGLSDATPLLETGREKLYKVAVFVPVGYEDTVRQAMGDAGAGYIGNYSHCTFAAPGTGTFKALPGATPFLGRVGELERAAELRLETIAPASRLPSVLSAMLAAHPYEEVAYDVYALENQGPQSGLGRVGKVRDTDGSPAITGRDWLRRCQAIWPSVAASSVAASTTAAPSVCVTAGASRLDALFSSAAGCSGDGGRLVDTAIRRGAAALVTGETGYHDRMLAEEEGLLLVEVGHGPSEAVYLPILADRLGERAAAAGWDVDLEVVLH